jgi:hypothetical protein
MLRNRAPFLVGLIAVLTAGLLTSGCTQTVATYTVPKIKMPSPNAYDILNHAWKLIESPAVIDEAGGVVHDSRKKPRAYREDEKAALVEKNQPALKELRRGLKYDYRQPFKYGMDALYPEYSHYRTMARLLMFDAQSRASHGDYSGAVSSCQDGLLLGEIVANGDGNSGLGKLVGIASQKIEHSLVWDVVTHLTSRQAKTATARMDEIAARHVSLVDSLGWEKEAQLLFFQDCFDGKKYASEPDMKQWGKMPTYIRVNVYTRYAAYMDQSMGAVQQPYASKPIFPEIKQSKDPLATARYAPADIFLSIFSPVPDRTWYADLYSETRNRLLQIAFALQAYHADQGMYPDKLNDLVPRYLKRIPGDLFALSGPLRYRRDGSQYILWSIGPDGKDDGGRPLDDSNKETSALINDRDRKGDIVAFINR